MTKILRAALMMTMGLYIANPASAAELYPSTKDTPAHVMPSASYIEPSTKSWTGFYIGLEAGGGAGIFEAARNLENGLDVVERYTHGTAPDTTKDLGRVLTDSRHDKLDLGLDGFFGGANIGAKQQIGNSFVVGVEGYFDFGKFKGSDSYSRQVSLSDGIFNPIDGKDLQLGEEHGSISVERKWSAGIDLTPGVLVTNDTLVYGIVGVNWGRFNIKGNSDITLIEGTFQPYPGSSFDKDDTLLGIKLGAGFQTRFGSDKRWSLAVEGYHIGYDDLKAVSSGVGAYTLTDPDCDHHKFDVTSSTNDKASGDLGVWEVKAKVIYQIY